MTTEQNKSPPQHTALPWHYDHQTKEIYILDDENEPCDVIADMETFKTPIDKAHTNGEFIAHACNNHYEMLAALEACKKQLALLGDFAFVNLLTQYNIAIAKARGQR
jgi:hypothetical protein